MSTATPASAARYDSHECYAWLVASGNDARYHCSHGVEASLVDRKDY